MTNLIKIFWIVMLPTFSMFLGGPNNDLTLSQAISIAEKENRQLMLYFTSEPCKQCKSLDSYLAKEDVKNALDKNFIVVHVDIQNYDGRACSEIYQIDELPALVVIEASGTVKYKAQGNLTKEDVEPIVLTGILPASPPTNTISDKTENSSESVGQDKAYAIQIGYFSSQKNANELKSKAEAEGYNYTKVHQEERNNKTFYRVLVGGYSGADVAKSDLEHLESSGFSVKVHKY